MLTISFVEHLTNLHNTLTIMNNYIKLCCHKSNNYIYILHLTFVQKNRNVYLLNSII